MRFVTFRALHFRNLAEVSLEPHRRCNVFFGENGQGKTNLLEALYLLSTLRSFRSHRMEEWIEFGYKQSLIFAQTEHDGVSHELEIEFIREKLAQKISKVDGKVQRSVDYLGRVHAILFVPEDLSLPKGPPSLRRKFLDRAVWNLYPSYLKEVQIYERILKQRNALLRLKDLELLPVYDEQLAHAGALIYRRRTAYIEELGPKFSASFERISQSGRIASLAYHGSYAPSLEGDVEHTLLEKLRRDQRRDLEKGYTHAGPHADDLDFSLDERSVASHASQGQTRALILALKIAEIQHFCQRQGFAPVLLLDDVSSELDAVRTEQFFSFLQEIPSQIFITTTDKNQIPLTLDRKNFFISTGKIL